MNNDLPTCAIELKQFGPDNSSHILRLENCLLDSGTSDVLITAASLTGSSFFREKLINILSIANALNQKSDTCISEFLHCNIRFPKFKIELINIKIFIVQGQMHYPCILGMSVLRRLKCDFRPEKCILSNNNHLFGKNPIIVNNTEVSRTKNNFEISDSYKPSFPHLRSTELFCVGPFQESHIPCKGYNFLDFETGEELRFNTSKKLIESGIFAYPKFEKSRLFLKVKNFEPDCILINNDCYLGSLVSVEKAGLIPDHEFTKICNFLMKFEALTESEKRVHEKEIAEWKNFRNQLVKKVSIKGEIEAAVRQVPSNLQKALEKVLFAHHWIFARSESDAGLNEAFLVDLRLKPSDDGNPHFSCPYKSDESLREKINSKIEDLKHSLVLESANSAWNLPLLCVLKKNGSLRVVNNFSSNLNSRLLQGRYPIIPMRVLLAQISLQISKIKSLYPNDPILFTNCDIRNGYYSVSIRNSKRDYTAFIVGHEQLRYRRLSQGLSLAPSTFSHFMSEVFSSLKKRGEDSGKFGLFSYLDDYILVSAQSFHVEAIEIILKKCEEANLVMALQKCSFANSVVEFVGFKVSSTGYTVKKSKVDALLNLKYPTSKKEAMQYLNSFTYFSCSIPRLSFLMSPLCDEIKNKKFELTDRVKLSLEKLKDSIRGGVGTTHLSYSNLGQQKIFLAVDSSMVAAGYALGNCIFDGQTPTEITFSHFGSTNFDNITIEYGLEM